jgi:superfamily II DNA or RNA helicase
MSKERIELDDEAKALVARMASELTRACLNASDTGTGKTVQAVELARQIGAQTILVAGPVRKTDVANWRDTFVVQGIDLPFNRIDSSEAGAEAFRSLRGKKPGVYHVGREYLGLSHRDGTYAWAKAKPDLAIVDEVQFATNPKAHRTKGLFQLRNAKYRLALSATPQGNKFVGLWSVCRFLWWYEKDAKGQPLIDTSFRRWCYVWATPKVSYSKDKDGNVQEHVAWTDEKHPGSFVAQLPCAVAATADFKVPVDVIEVKLDLPKEQREVYDSLEEKSVALIGDEPLTAPVALTLLLRLRQVTLGLPDIDPDTGDLSFAVGRTSVKLQALRRVVEQEHPDEKVLVFTSSRLFADSAAEEVQSWGIGARAYTGTLSQTDRYSNLQAFLDDPEVRVLVASIPSIAEGTDGLQRVCHTEVWLDEDLNGMLVEQAQGRLNRRGQAADKITRYVFHALDTEDEGHFTKLIERSRSARKELLK